MSPDLDGSITIGNRAPLELTGASSFPELFLGEDHLTEESSRARGIVCVRDKLQPLSHDMEQIHLPIASASANTATGHFCPGPWHSPSDTHASRRCLALGSEVVQGALEAPPEAPITGISWGYATKQCRKSGGILARMDTAEEAQEVRLFLTEHVLASGRSSNRWAQEGGSYLIIVDKVAARGNWTAKAPRGFASGRTNGGSGGDFLIPGILEPRSLGLSAGCSSGWV